MKKLFVIFTAVFILVAALFGFMPKKLLVYAKDSNLTSIESEKIQPKDGSLIYGFKRLKERFFLFCYGYSPSKKLKYLEKLVKVRLSEFKSTVDQNDIANIEKASQRYFTSVGIMTDYLLSDDSLKGERLIINSSLINQRDLVSTMLNKFVYDSAEWMFVKQVSDYLDIYIAKIN